MNAMSMIGGVELKEYLYANTLARTISTTGADPDTARDAIREAFRLHRFDVITWLAANGVSIPVNLLADEAHPPVGEQLPDSPTEKV